MDYKFRMYDEIIGGLKNIGDKRTIDRTIPKNDVIYFAQAGCTLEEFDFGVTQTEVTRVLPMAQEEQEQVLTYYK